MGGIFFAFCRYGDCGRLYARKDYITAFKTIENLGLVFFVSSVGFLAGPIFFNNFKRFFKSYILLGVIIIVVGAFACVACYYVGSSKLSSWMHISPPYITDMLSQHRRKRQWQPYYVVRNILVML